MSDPNDTKSGFELVGGEPHAWLIEARQLKRAADLVLPELRACLQILSFKLHDASIDHQDTLATVPLSPYHNRSISVHPQE